MALNVPSTRWTGGGDWHQYSAWFWATPQRVEDSDLTPEDIYGRLLDRLGNTGLCDARSGLACLNHPAARQPEKIWAASHERGVIELSWARLQRYLARGQPVVEPTVDADELNRLLPSPDQWLRAHWWAWRLAE